MTAAKHLGVKYRAVGLDHSVCLGTHPTIKDFFSSLPACSRAIVAIHPEDGIIGWLRYDLVERKSGLLLWAQGTWVASEYRGRGISHEVWGRAMQREEPVRVHVRTITPEGRAIVGAVVRWFPEVEFLVLT